MNTTTLKRLKTSQPFSQRLNDWVHNRVSNIMYTAGKFENKSGLTATNTTENEI